MKHLKSFNESTEFTLEQRLEHLYGKEVIQEYTQLMADIKDRCYDLIDLGFDVKIDWSYSTKEKREKTPKVEIHITGESSEYDKSWNEVVLPKDTVYHLGDFFLTNDLKAIDEILAYEIIFHHDLEYVMETMHESIKKFGIRWRYRR